jgi:response regulator RpfG family c-di-GMP phosphodiesterase
MELTFDQRVLLVDDEPCVLEGLLRAVRRRCDAYAAASGAEGLAALERDGPFAAVVSDLRMPGMDGIAFLRAVRERAPQTVRILLTGQADLAAAVEAVNEGHIFRFLAKPCPLPVLLRAIADAIEQYRLVTAERVLLERTLHGCIETLTDILALVSPTAFGRATRAKQYVAELAEHLRIEQRWQVEVAAMLSQIGCVTLAAETAEKLYYGRPLSDEEQAMVDHLPLVADKLLAYIPRLEEVRRILVYQGKHFDGGGLPPDAVAGEQIPWGARALHIALDFDALQARGLSVGLSLDILRSRAGRYDPALLEVFATLRGEAMRHLEWQEVPLRALRLGMVIAEDIKTRTGVLVIARGQEVTESLCERVRNLPRILGVVEPVRVLVRGGAS